MTQHPIWCSAIALALGLAGCRSGNRMQPAAAPSSADRAAGWQSLFDGRTTTGWRGYRTDTVPSAWKVVNGELTKSVSTGDIVTRAKFTDFDLRFEWRIGQGGNSGAFYRATEEFDHIYWTGPEYQLLDDAAAPDGKNRLTAAGAAYGLYPAPPGIVKPANQWNSSRILVRGHHVEHWLNGRKLLEYDLLSPDWEAKVRASKFAPWPRYGREPRGFIGFQGDHNGELALRHIEIRELR